LIRIARGPEPVDLTRERQWRLAQAMLARAAGAAIDFSGYEKAKPALVQALALKCAFCEMALRPEGSPVEHFRPKNGVHNEGETPLPDLYWWLAWTWENLLFACFRCNSCFKRNQFPLEAGTPVLPQLSVDLDFEKRLFVDPSREDPRDHIRFIWSKARAKWLPVPVAGSRRGAATIDRLGLDEDELPSRHVSQRVQPWIDELQVRIAAGVRGEVQATWHRVQQALFSPNEPFHSVTWDVLDAQFPAAVRGAWGLRLPVLGRAEDSNSPALFGPAPAGADRLPADLALRVRALSPQHRAEELRAVLGEVLALGPWTDEALGLLFGRAAATMGAHRRALAVP
jgi:hypothetical protein